MICDDCEYKNLALSETHTEMHTVVRITEGETEHSTEARLQILEDKLAKTEETLANKLTKIDEERLQSLEDKLAKTEEILGSRLAKIEEMLTKLMEKSTDGSRGDPPTRGGPHAEIKI